MKEVNYELAQEILQAMVKHYGRSKYFDFIPNISISDDDSVLSGEWRSDWEEIVLYTPHFDNIPIRYIAEEMATVIAHEYCHYLQSPTWLTRYSKMYDYYENPYELQAYKFEDSWRDIPEIAKLVNNHLENAVH